MADFLRYRSRVEWLPQLVVPELGIELTVAQMVGVVEKGSETGKRYVAPIDVLLAKHDIVQPDLLFVSNASLKILAEMNVQGAPDLVIEVLSGSTRKSDEGLKLERYELLGVQEYWVVDPRLNEARIFRRAGERFQQVAELKAAARDLLTSPFFPGLEIPLFEIFL